MEETGMIEANADTPVTAEWLRSNTRIRGWLALFMLALVVSALRSLAQAGATMSAADCYGSGILATTDVVSAVESFANEDFDNLAHQMVSDDLTMVNGNKCYYRVVKYGAEDGSSFYWHFTILFDSDTGKEAALSGYFPSSDAKDMKGVLESTRFHR